MPRTKHESKMKRGRRNGRRNNEHFTAKTAAEWLSTMCQADIRDVREEVEHDAEELQHIVHTMGDVPPELMEQFARACNDLGIYDTNNLRRTLFGSYAPVLNAQDFITRFVDEARAADLAASQARSETLQSCASKGVPPPKQRPLGGRDRMLPFERSGATP